ncbi:aryl-sulfate sulfotransferase [Olivibacter sp. XZL3]|uniref:aryl-sulfate sulfotransferase n=1 Tax=Olivibacter sp. XZL3 TaxID=1735116 RepID=UPI001416F6E6|nr:aryl-sulfate sulfotransferase [Olivibacter sp. XZL3]
MNKKNILVSLFIVALLYGGYYFYSHDIQIVNIQLSSPDNSAIKEDIRIQLNKPATVYVEYWAGKDGKHYLTPVRQAATEHLINLLLLEAETDYHYRIVLDRLVPIKSKTMHFQTRKQSPWMVHDWIKENHPHDAGALGEGLTMLCYREFPGYIAMVDGKGVIKWYWQEEKMGVRIASLTPRGTVLALLAPVGKDEFAKPQENKPFVKSGLGYSLRTGKTGFMGGTELVEIDLTGYVRWRLNTDKLGMIVHHDLRMDQSNHIVAVVRDYILDERKQGIPRDTLWGDGVVVMDTTGKVLKKWSAWDQWDTAKDVRLDSLKHDRFHINTISFDKDSNYIVSSPIENQVWKIDAQTGKTLWRLGKGGDFQMNASDYFYFQHAPHINQEGDLMLFDNGDFSPRDSSTTNKVSRALSFTLNTEEKTATKKLDVPLPNKQYTARMGSAYLLPNGNILQTSSKTGSVLISDKLGKVLWELNTYFIPYRAEYVPDSLWKKYRRTE